jgi:long-chain acyl-CoA synthetase
MDHRPWHRFYDYNMPISIRQPQLSVADLLQIPSNAYPDKAAVHFLGREITFWELRQQVPRMVEFRESLPQSAVGKVLRRMLRDEEIRKKEQ